MLELVVRKVTVKLLNVSVINFLPSLKSLTNYISKDENSFLSTAQNPSHKHPLYLTN